MKHARIVLLTLGAICGAGLFGGFVAALLVIMASNSLAGQNLRHQQAAERKGETDADNG